MDKQIVLAAVAAGLLLNGCAAKESDKAPGIDVAVEQQAIRDRSAAWMQAMQARDAAKIGAEFYAQDAMSIYDGNVRKGRGEIEAGIEQDLGSSPDSTLTWTTDSVGVAASGELAYELGTLHRDPDGAGPQPQVTGGFVTVWRKLDGKWVAVVDAGTENLPPAATTPAS